MRKIAFSLALAVGLLGAGAANAWTAQATADINMRSGPGTGYAPLLVIPRGAVVEAGACSSWCQVFFAGYRGFVSARYLAPVGGGGYYQPAPPPPPVVVVPPPYYRPAPPPYYRPGPPPGYRPPHYRHDRYDRYDDRPRRHNRDWRNSDWQDRPSGNRSGSDRPNREQQGYERPSREIPAPSAPSGGDLRDPALDSDCIAITCSN